MSEAYERPDDLSESANELRVVMGRLVRRLRQVHAAGELTLAELSALSRLEQCGPLPAGALAEQERISPQAMSVIVGLLEQRGLVGREPDVADARRHTLSATSAGRALLAGRRSLAAQRLAVAMRESLTPQEVSQLVDVLPLLSRLSDEL
jgi:DNA-binding MarR family transcriptional regulator